ncbi:MAG TPA: hypothetical protein VGA50_04600 [Kiloniellales bacterium]
MAAKRAQMVVAPEFVRVARQLPARMEKRVYSGALNAGAQVIRREAIAKLEGGGRADVIVKRQRRSLTGAIASVAIGVSSARWWLVFTEFGRQALDAPAGSAIPMHLEDGSIVFTKHAKAVPPRPFFRPAWDAKNEEAVRTMGAALLRGLTREAQKLAGSFAKSGLGRRR